MKEIVDSFVILIVFLALVNVGTKREKERIRNQITTKALLRGFT